MSQPSIAVEVNGEPRSLPSASTVTSLLRHLELEPARVAVELNREILSRDRYDQPLGAGDRLEIVTFVGGG